MVWDAANHAPARSGSSSSSSQPPSPHLGTIVEHTALQAALYERLQVRREAVRTDEGHSPSLA